MNAFKYEESQNNINYNIIENIKNYEETFELYKMKKLDKINEESNKFISLFQTIGLQKNVKTLIYHTSWVYYLLKLKDGRLASCSADKTLKIYSKDKFEVQLSISHHSDYIHYITQLNNENLLTCSRDKTMAIIKLIDDNKYSIEQKLIGHIDFVANAVEIKVNELISVSYDKTMKIWHLNNNNKYECINTINFQNSNNFAYIFKLNENEFITFSYLDKCLKFWSSNNYSIISTINNIEKVFHGNNFGGQLYKMDDDILCFGGIGFYLIKISNHQLIKKIVGYQIHSIYKCHDGLFLCLIYTGKYNYLVKYKYRNQNLIKIIEKQNVFPGVSFSNCIELNEEMIATAHVNYKNYILLWRN